MAFYAATSNSASFGKTKVYKGDSRELRELLVGELTAADKEFVVDN